jgi:excisionase family DNA binding protein
MTEIVNQAVIADGAMSIRKAVQFTGFSRSFLYEMMEDGRLPYIKIGRARRIPKRALLDLLQQALVVSK